MLPVLTEQQVSKVLQGYKDKPEFKDKQEFKAQLVLREIQVFKVP